MQPFFRYYPVCLLSRAFKTRPSFILPMTKRAHSIESHANKKSRSAASNHYNKIASVENATAADNDPPLPKLLDAMKNQSKPSQDGAAVVYWMRMQDMRINDNRALSEASSLAQSLSLPLIVMFAISPQDYAAHDRGPRRIDFMLRNLSLLKNTLNELHIPLYTFTHKPRKTLPSKIISVLESWGATYLYGNIEYEVDELRRDIQTCEIASEKGVQCTFLHDKPMVEPNTLKTQAGKPYTVYSPWLKSWIKHFNDNMILIEESPKPKANDKSFRSKEPFSGLFDTAVPQSVPGFECADRDKMKEYWPEGYKAARARLERFLKGKDGSQKKTDKEGMIHTYNEDRDRADMDGTSGLSPYLASGVISSRECLRETMALSKARKVEANRGNGPGTWIQELAWRDFYIHVLAAFPRVSMGRPFLQKFADVKWEVNAEHLQAWKDGKTGVPIVDAGMRQIKEMGWIHNRCRMIVAMYLTKDLMLDWRLGEKYFMENLLDGDLASNNGGWQWSASTGTDPQPYFRIFNPASQSLKADPTGDYIRKYVPELAKLKGKSLYAPSPESANVHGYPRPMVDHKSARERALRRYKNPGEE